MAGVTWSKVQKWSPSSIYSDAVSRCLLSISTVYNPKMCHFIHPYRSTGITCEKNNVCTSDTGIIESVLSYTKMKYIQSSFTHFHVIPSFSFMEHKQRCLPVCSHCPFPRNESKVQKTQYKCPDSGVLQWWPEEH